MMCFYAYCLLLLIFPTRCSCGLIEEVKRWSEKRQSEEVKCLKRLMNVTHWESNNFLLISKDLNKLESGFIELTEIYGWKLLRSMKKIIIKEFVDVIIFTENFDSLNEIFSTIDMKPMNPRVKFLISVKKRFTSLNEIRNASKGISEAIWKSDKTRVILLVPVDGVIFAMTYFPFANNCRPGNLEILNVWRRGSFAKEINFFPEKMLDIRGCVKNYSAISYPNLRIQGFKEYTKEGVAVLGGVGGKLVSIIAEKINMNLHLLSDEPKTWELLMSQIENDESIFSVIGNIPMAKYLKILDQDVGYMQESFGFGYLTGGFGISWKNFVLPMGTAVWEWTGYTFLFSCSVFIAANLVHRKTANRFDQLKFVDFFGVFIGNTRVLPSTGFGRYLFGIWIFYSYLITSAYNSGLVSFLTTQNEKRVINSFGDLIVSGLDFGGGNFHRDFYDDPTDPVMMEIYNNFKIWSNEESLRSLMSGQGATGVVTSMCDTFNREQRGKGDNQLRMLRDKVFTFRVPISMRRGSPFTIGVNYYARQAIQSGLVQYWLNYYTDVESLKKIRKKAPTVITMRHLRGIFYLHIIGLSFSWFAFIGELMFRKNFFNCFNRRSFTVA